MTPLQALIGWSYGPAPACVRDRARLLVLDTLGCALAALGHPAVSRLAAALGDSPLGRATWLAAATCWDEFCEGLARAHGRPGVPVVAAGLALGLERKAALGEVLDAVITGYEVGARMGEALRIRPEMHVDAGWPALGAAAGAARVLGGTASQAHAAVELAAAQLPFGLYLPVTQGADGRNTYLGHAAWLGAYGALSVLAGITAPQGAADAYSKLALHGPERPTLASPDRYLMLEGYFKPYAAVRHVHYGAAAGLSLRGGLGDTRAIRGIDLEVYPEAITYCANPAPRTAIQAQFSLSFGVAAALRFGGLSAASYRSPQFDDPELRRLESLVRVRADPAAGAAGRAAKLVLSLEGGATRECKVNAVKGDAANPMSRSEICDKFAANARGRLGERSEALALQLLDGPESASLPSILKGVLP